MRKLLLGLALLATVATGCKKEDSPKTKAQLAVGKWNVVAFYEDNVSTGDDCVKDDYWELNADGSGKSDAGLIKCGNNTTQSVIFDYTISTDGNYMTLTAGNETDRYDIKTLDENKMVLNYNSSTNSTLQTVEFSRVK